MLSKYEASLKNCYNAGPGRGSDGTINQSIQGTT